jgi:hypothetical protein
MLKRDPVGSNDVPADRLGRGNQPGVVLGHPTCRATLPAAKVPPDTTRLLLLRGHIPAIDRIR